MKRSITPRSHSKRYTFLESLFLKHYVSLLSFTSGLLFYFKLTGIDAEEFLADLFIKFATKYPNKLENVDSPLAFLKATIKNQIKNAAKKIATSSRYYDMNFDVLLKSNQGYTVVNQGEVWLMQEDLQKWLEITFTKEEIVIFQMEADGFSRKEIAQKLNIEPNTLAVKVFRARAKAHKSIKNSHLF